ncbi:M20/M25/M40 family metallo-hydrolase [Elongatibacter sediminis]|uniref:Carboxypeptidase Q n=1 Tax=Elongatibacter sediminis TaxID=3119006 RepID=A0AAW9RBQ2_9GAMM
MCVAVCQPAFLFLLLAYSDGAEAEPDASELAGAFLASTPLMEDLRVLSDEIGGRITGSAANERAIEWAVERFRSVGLAVETEPYQMERRWLPGSAEVAIQGDGVRFAPRVVAVPFSTATPSEGVTAPLLYGGFGEEEDFQRMGNTLDGSFVLIETRELRDEDGLLNGLFVQYARARDIELEAFRSGAAGIVYMSTRPKGLLYQHKAFLGPRNAHPMLTMEREGAQRAVRLLQAGKALEITVNIDVNSGGSYTSANVVAELPGSELPDEIVLLGAHLDSWGLGTGALDNGANVAAVIDTARQIQRLGLKPRRTIRFVLFNGEEQGLQGSLAYVRRHNKELDRYVMAMAMDLGTGKITDFFANGRSELEPVLQQLLAPVEGLGPFRFVNELATGTDTFDFMLEGIATTVAFQAASNYPSNYHSESDTFDKVDPVQLRLNTSVIATLTYGFANVDVTWRRHDRKQVEALVNTLELKEVQKDYPPWQEWFSGSRGRSD